MSRPQYPSPMPFPHGTMLGNVAPPGTGPQLPQSPMVAQAATAPASPYGAATGGMPKNGGASPAGAFIIIGAVLLVLLSAIPLWNAAMLLQDDNYTFWAGHKLPMWIIGACVGVLLLYVLSVAAFFSVSGQQVQTEQTIMMMANLFIMLLGLALVLVSLPLSRQAVDTYDGLMHQCDFSLQAQFLQEYSQVLHNIRSTPSCAALHSVEECEGYEAEPPYTSMLKAMEHDFRCTGFCHFVPATPSLLESTTHRDSRRRRAGRWLASTEPVVGLLSRGRTTLASQALFSVNTYGATCEGASARGFKTLAGDIGVQTFYQGIYLMNLAVLMGFLKLLSYCVRRDQSSNIFKPPY